MGRIISIDYGKKRTGLATTDVLKLIANGLCTVKSSDTISFLKTYIEKEPVELFVVGLPKQMNNEPSESMKYITPFVNLLKKSFPSIPVEMVDERFTSALAHQAMIDGGLKKKERQNKALVDEISAVIILQSYMESRRFK
ncbi:MAG: Holliday junction resolvase RuvX [Bacteroidales bacterium]|nr:Holliday junction resolvase RuvX [Bacteroidales bacterium]